MSSKCCSGGADKASPTNPCTPPPSPCCSGAAPSAGAEDCPFTYFENMIPHCLAHAQEAAAAGKPVVGIMCEYTPRELIMAAGAVPVCLCGGSADTIAAAEAELPANLCPLIKSTFGYFKEGSNPFLEMASLIVAETTCDGKKKMYELMGESKPMCILELPQKQGDPDAFAHWEAEVRKLKSELENRFNTAITDDRIREAIATMNRERRLRRQLAGLMKQESPPLTGRQLLNLKSSISGIPGDFAQYEKALGSLSAENGSAVSADRVRVLMTGVPMAHGAERVLDIIEGHGGLVVCMENCTGLKPILEDVEVNGRCGPLRALAEKYFHLPCSVMTRNDDRLESLRNLAAEYRAECIVELVWQACLTYDVEAARIKRLAEQECAIPYLRIETDYSPSDSARIAVRVEALLETVRQRRNDGKAACVQ